MSDDTNPYSGATGTEPTVPMRQPQGYAQPDDLGMEPTIVDPFGASERPHPDFSYGGVAGSTGQRDDWGVGSEPAMSATSYTGSSRTALPGYAQPGYAEPDAVPPVQAVYQPYPAPTMPAAAPLVASYPPPQAYGYVQLPEHPSAIPSLVLGLVGLVLAIPFASPIAWYLAARGQRESQLQPGRWRTSGMLTVGLVLGIIGTVIWGLFVGLMVLVTLLG